MNDFQFLETRVSDFVLIYTHKRGLFSYNDIQKVYRFYYRFTLFKATLMTKTSQ